jgi:hypothetical protein
MLFKVNELSYIKGLVALALFVALSPTVYARYQFTPIFALAGRAEYLSCRGRHFSGLTRALKEATLTADFKLIDGSPLRGEWPRDFPNRPFLLADTPGIFKKERNTATVGLTWWIGRKEGDR